MRHFRLLGSCNDEQHAHSPRDAAIKLSFRHGSVHKSVCMRILDVHKQTIHTFDVGLVPLEHATPYTLRQGIQYRAAVSKRGMEKVG